MKLAEQRKAKAKEEIFKANAKVNLDDLFNQISDGVKTLNVIVKADVAGSAEAVKAYCAVGEDTDPFGSYTGLAEDPTEKPVQDADDL